MPRRDWGIIALAGILLGVPSLRAASPSPPSGDPLPAAQAWAMQDLLRGLDRRWRSPLLPAPDIDGLAGTVLRLEVRGQVRRLAGRRYPSDADFDGLAEVLAGELRAIARALGPGASAGEAGPRSRISEQVRMAAWGLIDSMPAQSGDAAPAPGPREKKYMELALGRRDKTGFLFPPSAETRASKMSPGVRPPREPQTRPAPTPPEAPAYGAEFGKRFVDTWRKELPALASLKPQREFIERKGIEILIHEPEASGLFQEDWADLRENRMTINRRMLLSDAEALRAKGASPEDLPALLARKMLPLLAHELRHAIALEQLAAKGSDCPGQVLDAELDANLDALEVAREVERSRPGVFDPALRTDFDEGVRSLIDSASGGWDTLSKHTRSLYPERVWLSERPRERFLAELEGSLFAVRQELDRVRRAGGGAQDDPRKEELLAAALPRLERCRKTFSDPARFDAFRAYFLARRKGMGPRLGLE